MSYVSPDVRDAFESLSIDMKNKILEQNPTINTIADLRNLLSKVNK